MKRKADNLILFIIATSTVAWALNIESGPKVIKCQSKSISTYSSDYYMPGSIIRTYMVDCPNQAPKAVARFEASPTNPKKIIEFKVKENRLIDPLTELIICLIVLALTTVTAFNINLSEIKKWLM